MKLQKQSKAYWRIMTNKQLFYQTALSNWPQSFWQPYRQQRWYCASPRRQRQANSQDPMEDMIFLDRCKVRCLWLYKQQYTKELMSAPQKLLAVTQKGLTQTFCYILNVSSETHELSFHNSLYKNRISLTCSCEQPDLCGQSQLQQDIPSLLQFASTLIATLPQPLTPE